MTPAQSLAARGLLGLSQAEVAKPANVAPTTVADFENETRVPNVNHLRAIREVLEAVGAMLISENGGGEGARLKAIPKPNDTGKAAISPEQCRAARYLSKLSQLELAEAAGVGRSTVADFERGARVPSPANLEALRETLEGAGVVFIEADSDAGPGVRLRR